MLKSGRQAPLADTALAAAAAAVLIPSISNAGTLGLRP
jgi:hypothetical protein